MVFIPSFFASLVTVIATTSKSQASTLRKLSGTEDGPTYASPDQYAQLVLGAVNNQRATQNLPPLCLNAKLYQAAQRHTNDMANQHFMGHQGSDGSTPESRITDANYVWTAVAENVASGQVDVQAVMDSWDHSPEHLENIMGDYTMFASAYTYNEESELKHHWTQDFASSDIESCDGVTPAANTTPAATTMQGTPAPQFSTPSIPDTNPPPALVPPALTTLPSVTTASVTSTPLTPASQTLVPTVPLAVPPMTPAGTSSTPECPTNFENDGSI